MINVVKQITYSIKDELDNISVRITTKSDSMLYCFFKEPQGKIIEGGSGEIQLGTGKLLKNRTLQIGSVVSDLDDWNIKEGIKIHIHRNGLTDFEELILNNGQVKPLAFRHSSILYKVMVTFNGLK
ncbi:MAG: hypothetical protein HN921_00855 [Bacteroidetes bacterium]|jgi:hypothetical protein|nr:hypothetical protein [Bacteroidota bacterium]MBT3423636.1 hypothetical protein [Bacteroidota bacterium]MBT3933225.1 hypothetical protein [Bacteroidota bacterium]MBT4729163.1 hypothetical protein [Bacteroidota bacterium]MBT4968932.1 hypothetical protein [Bacteroidota bacterium]